ncbi:MAG: ribonuclease HI family protein [Nitrospiraceae bacterium]|nr:ribonuclease HI family protein [Nitrospiraceae bacterium]
MKEGTLYSDGGSSGNPGTSGIGVVLIYDTAKLELSEYIGISTNNIAEYTALIRGLTKAKELNIEKLTIFLDSELVVRQIKGIYKVKNENLAKLYQKTVALLASFSAYTIDHIPREENAEADKLAKKAIKALK